MKKNAMKIVALFTAILLCAMCTTVCVFADNAVLKSVGGTVEVDGESNATVSVCISASTDMVLQLIMGEFSTSEEGNTNYFKLIGISSDKIVFDGVNYAYDVNTGELVWMDDTYAGLTFDKDAPVLVATYEVAANTPAGSYTVNFTNEVIADGDYNEYYDNFVFNITVTHQTNCEHTTTKAVSNNNGTHNVVCTNEACNGYVVTPDVACNVSGTNHTCECGYGADNHTHSSYKTENGMHQSVCSCGELIGNAENCSGGTATCKELAVCATCNTAYGELAACVDGDDKDHLCDYGCGQVADNGCHGGEYEYDADNHWKLCAECGEKYAEDVHTFGENGCECGIKLGWFQIGDAWYYVTANGYAKGLTRVPYPTVAINNIEYKANEEDVAYAQADENSPYTDAETAVFVFGEDGKFLSDKNGMIKDGNITRYAINGCIPWHVGMVQDGEDYYYFAGDTEDLRGNAMMKGYVWATRNFNSDLDTNAKYYIFGNDGKMIKNDGIVKATEGGNTCYRYFDKNAVVFGAGVVAQTDNNNNDFYIYVRSNGLLATGKYWPTVLNGLLARGEYDWGTDGRLYLENQNAE